MNAHDRTLSATAGALLSSSVFSLSAYPFVCLTSAIAALALSLYLRQRGAFRDDNTPLLGALLIGGSAMTVLGGLIAVSPKAGFVVMGLILVPILLFLVAFGVRERVRAFIRRINAWFPHDDKPQN
jgi:hypothetical protein